MPIYWVNRNGSQSLHTPHLRVWHTSCAKTLGSTDQHRKKVKFRIKIATQYLCKECENRAKKSRCRWVVNWILAHIPKMFCPPPTPIKSALRLCAVVEKKYCEEEKKNIVNIYQSSIKNLNINLMDLMRGLLFFIVICEKIDGWN